MIAAGANHVVVVTSSEMFAWGDATHGQLWGIAQSSSVPQQASLSSLMQFPLRAVAAGWLFSVAVDARGALWTCGQYTPSLKIAVPRPLFVESNVVVTHVACGMNHAMAIAVHPNAGNVSMLYGWGDNQHGQLGTQAGATLLHVPTVVDDVGDVVPRAIACGRRHSVLVTANGALLGLGCNRYQQLPNADLPERVLPIDDVRCLWDASVVIGARQSDGSFGVHVVGKAVFGATLINRSTIKRWRSVSCGSEHLAAVDTRGTVHMYGWNEHGQLGRGDTEPLDESAVDGVVPAQLAHVLASDVVCGAGFTIASS